MGAGGRTKGEDLDAERVPLHGALAASPAWGETRLGFGIPDPRRTDFVTHRGHAARPPTVPFPPRGHSFFLSFLLRALDGERGAASYTARHRTTRKERVQKGWNGGEKKKTKKENGRRLLFFSPSPPPLLHSAVPLSPFDVESSPEETRTKRKKKKKNGVDSLALVRHLAKIPRVPPTTKKKTETHMSHSWARVDWYFSFQETASDALAPSALFRPNKTRRHPAWRLSTQRKKPKKKRMASDREASLRRVVVVRLPHWDVPFPSPLLFLLFVLFFLPLFRRVYPHWESAIDAAPVTFPPHAVRVLFRGGGDAWCFRLLRFFRPFHRHGRPPAG